jgi:hypothetical protein
MNEPNRRRRKTMEKIAMDQAISKPGTDLVRRLFLAVSIVLLVAAAGFAALRFWEAYNEEAQAAKMAERQAAAMAQIEDRWGIRVTQVMATADGGLVDLRYQITDPDKAVFLYDDIRDFPRLVTEDSGVEIAINNLSHEHDLEFGRTYFVIYRNVAGAVKPGGLVTLFVGDLKVEHFQVER